MSDLTTTTLPVLPLRSGIVFPHMVITVGIESAAAKRALAAAESTGGRLVLIPVIDGEYSAVGTIAEIQEVTDQAGTSAIISGLVRARIGAGNTSSDEVLWVEVEPVDEPAMYKAATLARAAELRAVMEEILEQRGIRGVTERILATDNPSQLVDLLVYSPDLDLNRKAQLLATWDVDDRLDLALTWMNEVLAGMTLRQRVRDEAVERIDKNQKEFVLRQQMDAIRRELGDDEATVAGEYRQRL